MGIRACLIFSAMLLMAAGSPAQQASPPPQKQVPAQEAQPAKKAKKVWTNDDLQREEDPRRSLEEGSGAASDGPGAARDEGRERAGQSPSEKDESYYRKRISALQAKLNWTHTELYRQRAKLKASREKSGTSSSDTLTPNAYSIQKQIEGLERLQVTLQKEIEQLRAEAERKGYAPR
jgi:hypothetical protein